VVIDLSVPRNVAEEVRDLDQSVCTTSTPCSNRRPGKRRTAATGGEHCRDSEVHFPAQRGPNLMREGGSNHLVAPASPRVDQCAKPSSSNTRPRLQLGWTPSIAAIEKTLTLRLIDRMFHQFSWCGSVSCRSNDPGVHQSGSNFSSPTGGMVV